MTSQSLRPAVPRWRDAIIDAFASRHLSRRSLILGMVLSGLMDRTARHRVGLPKLAQHAAMSSRTAARARADLRVAGLLAWEDSAGGDPRTPLMYVGCCGGYPVTDPPQFAQLPPAVRALTPMGSGLGSGNPLSHIEPPASPKKVVAMLRDLRAITGASSANGHGVGS